MAGHFHATAALSLWDTDLTWIIHPHPCLLVLRWEIFLHFSNVLLRFRFRSEFDYHVPISLALSVSTKSQKPNNAPVAPTFSSHFGECYTRKKVSRFSPSVSHFVYTPHFPFWLLMCKAKHSIVFTRLVFPKVCEYVHPLRLRRTVHWQQYSFRFNCLLSRVGFDHLWKGCVVSGTNIKRLPKLGCRPNVAQQLTAKRWPDTTKFTS